ncbi:MAG: peptide-methionine (S)-S-oxide reductase MsrA [Planctomycetes bacterium]|nr:peptide-methionine (S)-S-oxide reductase MsrA [Planctomycetota bacterium]
METATLGAGCFWCVEAVFQNLEGVTKVVSGYSGGEVKEPTYEQVSSGRSGHAEVCQIVFDSKKITYEELLDVFFRTHDPTTLDRQGNDSGPQYRSVVFYHDETQRDIAQRKKRELESSGEFDDPIVTEIVSFHAFYPAEDYHQDYYGENPRQPYCTFVIRPKMEKLREKFADKLKKRE